ncbi:MAG: S26 family signal peptidase, partial [Gordonia sp. (in: high G+C Gram-positive bacteria)]|uniref:S26 family signal peptidase n=1 Tax=Gordonia sp. (in: high G+C Gram-positive bacteria) TaxID=84139 RepID=UPI003C74CD94
MDDNTRGDDPSQVDAEHGDEKRGEEKRGAGRWLRELAIIVAIVLALMFVFTQFLFRQYVVPSESMEPTLHGCYGCTNDRIVIDKLA